MKCLFTTATTIIAASLLSLSFARASMRSALFKTSAFALAAGILIFSATANHATGLQVVSPNATTAVLVHGAFADGSSWDKVIPLLQAKGLRVVAVQNPLTSLADDVAAAKRAIDAQAGPVILVGHSWGGTVITEAGNNQKVTALVYVAAFAPDAGQSTNDLKDYPPPAWLKSIVAAAGSLTLTPDAFAQYFAQDLPPSQTSVMAAAQAPALSRCFDETVTEAAWKNKPSWFVVADQVG